MDLLDDIVRLTNRRAVSLEEVQRKTKSNSKQLQEALSQGEGRGYQILVRDGFVSARVAVRAHKTVSCGSTKPGRYCVAYWSDTHFGCRHTDEKAAQDFLTHCWERGARCAVHTGDLLDGNRPVLLADQDYVGWDSQVARLRRTLKAAPPFEYVAIDGNHDGYFSTAAGTQCGKLVERALTGVKWHYLGMCEGRVEIHGASWFLWHPSGGSQSKLGIIKVLDDKRQNLPEHADVVACGHLHKFASANLDGALLVCPGTFQRKQSEFANRISGPWDIGGCLVSYELDRKGRIHEAAAEFMTARASS